MPVSLELFPEFYYSETQSLMNYSRTPTGLLDVNQLIADNPACWVAPTLPRIHKPKALVLADWTARTWDMSKIESVKSALYDVISQGFSIYIWQEGKVTLIEKDQLFNLLEEEHVRESITLASTDDITKAAVIDNKLSRDQIQVVDDYWLNHILKVKEKHEQEEFAKLFSFDPEDADAYSTLLTSLSTLSNSPQQILPEETLADVMDSKTPKIETGTLPPRELRTSRIDLLTPKEAKKLQGFFRNVTPRLEEIIHDTLNPNTIKIVSKLLDECHFDPVIKETVTIVNADRTRHSSSSSIEHLLKSTKNLSDITIYGVNMKKPISLRKNSLLSLNKAYINNSNISCENIQTLLNAAPNLNDLRMDDFLSGLKTSRLVLGENSLVNLNVIHFSPVDLRNPGESFTDFRVKCRTVLIPNLQTLLKAAPNLDQRCKNDINELISKLEKDTFSLFNLLTFSQPTNTTPVVSSEQNGDNNTENPEHDPTQMADFVPDEKEFEFKGNKTKSQAMLIEKLSQYLRMQGKHLEVIPKIQNGMCVALSQYFGQVDIATWDRFVEKALAWNGEEKPDRELKNDFKELLEVVKTHQLVQSRSYFLGDNLASFLQTKTAATLANPWHDIHIKPSKKGTWYVYDPNYLDGRQEVTQERLLDTIHSAIGTLVSIKAAPVNVACKIENPDDFIAHGGLLALIFKQNTKDMLAKLPENHLYSQDALDGILLRNTAGVPAWSLGLESHNAAMIALTKSLLEQFNATYPSEAASMLAKSLGTLTTAQRGECITQVVQLYADGSTEANALIEAIRTINHPGRYERALNTWDKTVESAPSALLYCHQCLVGEPHKRLIELDSTQHLDSLRLQLQQQAFDTHRPVFYIDKPDDLICSSPYMKKNQDNTGVLCKGPGGLLYEFLKENKDKRPLLIVNYEQFNADDIVRFNGLLDKMPNADGTALPENTKIIGLMNRNKLDCYQGSDFHSRFNRTERCPLSESQLDALNPARTIEFKGSAPLDSTIINLYHAPDWEARLLGRWVLDGDSLTFSEGELILAMKAGKPIEIQNGLWGDQAFQRFWLQAMTCGYLHAGRTLQIPEHIQLVRPKKDVYDWDALKTSISIIQEGRSVDPAVAVLNPTSLGDFFGRYELEGERLVKKQGILSSLASQVRFPSHASLAVNLTRTLSDDAWGMLLVECNRLDVRLSIHCSPGVSLPEAFSTPISSNHSMIEGVPTETKDLIIISTDMDTTIEMLTKTKQYEVIDVSECTPSDLMMSLDGKLNKDSLHFEFKQKSGALKTALTDNKNIILKGHFSSELLDMLAPVLFKREGDTTENQLILVTDDEKAGAYVLNRYSHTVSVKDKLSCLAFNEKTKHKVASFAQQESLSQLQARCRFLTLNPLGNSDDACIGLMNLSGETQASTITLNRPLSMVDSVIFTKARIAQVNAVFESSPYVFLTGLSGVGKSTFVEKELCTENDALYLTEARIEDWVNNKTDKRKILFIDEANLSARQWSEFEGLFNTPPSLLLNGQLHLLTENHKVIFAGNPVNYGDERQLAPFFQRHGNAVLFTPLPPSVIYEKILKPVFAGTDVDPNPISDRMLEVYRFVCECSTTEILISPRELQMMALLSITRAQRHPEQHIDAIAEHFSYELAKNLVPSSHRAEFDRQFQPVGEALQFRDSEHNDQDGNSKENAFLILPSRQMLSQQLADLLDLREWRSNSQATLNVEQKGGGLGGLIIEGEPGIGKSELVIAELRARNYTQIHDFEHPATVEKPFYKMPVSMPLSEKENLLIKAFNEGAVVLIDEINSSPMMERLLNDLLMGKNPRQSEGALSKPGFMVIGTQNPITMAGRRAPSTALRRRVITTTLPEYTPAEIKSILLGKGIHEEEVQSMVNAYENNRAYAINNQLSPVPNFRHLMNLADEQLAASTRTEPDTIMLFHTYRAKFKESLQEEAPKISSPAVDNGLAATSESTTTTRFNQFKAYFQWLCPAEVRREEKPARETHHDKPGI